MYCPIEVPLNCYLSAIMKYSIYSLYTWGFKCFSKFLEARNQLCTDIPYSLEGSSSYSCNLDKSCPHSLWMLTINHKQRPWTAGFSEVWVCHREVSTAFWGRLCVCEMRLWGSVFRCVRVRKSPWLQSYICRCGPPPRLSATGAADSTLGRRRLSCGGSSAVAYSSLSSLWTARETLY